MAQSGTNFLVNPYNDPVIVRIEGKAFFQNCAPVKELFDRLVTEGKRRFVIDFQKCAGMDSTFLGIIAGLGVSMLKQNPPGSIVLTRLGERNLELIRNLGLDRILHVDSGEALPEITGRGLEFIAGDSCRRSEIENARLVLEAHENLIAVDASNQTKFQDVISFLKNQVGEP